MSWNEQVARCYPRRSRACSGGLPPTQAWSGAQDCRFCSSPPQVPPVPVSNETL